MAETVKKTKAPAKKTAAKVALKAPAAAKKVAAKKVPAAEKKAAPSHHEISQLAHKLWTERGHHHGHADQDWLHAEQELAKKT